MLHFENVPQTKTTTSPGFTRTVPVCKGVSRFPDWTPLRDENVPVLTSVLVGSNWYKKLKVSQRFQAKVLAKTSRTVVTLLKWQAAIWWHCSARPCASKIRDRSESDYCWL